jgi:hypothetical protein
MTSNPWTLIPGDRVLFDGHGWEVFVAPHDQMHDSAVCIFRYDTPGRAGRVIDLIRPRCELTLVPRMPETVR